MGGPSYIKDGGAGTFLRLKKAVLEANGVFSSKRSTNGAFAVPLRLLNKTKMTGNNALL